MPKIIKIQVTQDDIDRGRRCVASQCPIARAVRRAFDKPYSVSVGTRYIIVCQKRRGPEQVFTMDANTCHWRHEFDMARSVQPFSFPLCEPY